MTLNKIVEHLSAIKDVPLPEIKKGINPLLVKVPLNPSRLSCFLAMGAFLGSLALTSYGSYQTGQEQAYDTIDQRLEQIHNLTKRKKEEKIEVPEEKNSNLLGKEAIKDINKSVFCIRKITTYSSGMISIGHGTAFAYERRNNITYLSTNHHVADVISPYGIDKIELFLVDNKYDQDSSNDIPLQLHRSNYFVDTAVVTTEEDLHVSKAYEILPENKPLMLTDRIYMIGFPKAIEKQVSEGIVSNIKRNKFVTNIDTYPGNSGSPILLEDHEKIYLVGQTNSCYIMRLKSEETMCLSYAIVNPINNLIPIWYDF